MECRKNSKEIAVDNTNEALKILYGESYRYLVSSLHFNATSLNITGNKKKLSVEDIRRLRELGFVENGPCFRYIHPL